MRSVGLLVARGAAPRDFKECTSCSAKPPLTLSLMQRAPIDQSQTRSISKYACRSLPKFDGGGFELNSEVHLGFERTRREKAKATRALPALRARARPTPTRRLGTGVHLAHVLPMQSEISVSAVDPGLEICQTPRVLRRLGGTLNPLRRQDSSGPLVPSTRHYITKKSTST